MTAKEILQMPLGVNLMDLKILAVLHLRGTANPKLIVDDLGTNKGTVGHGFKRLEGHGLIHRCDLDSDRNVKKWRVVALTDQGREFTSKFFNDEKTPTPAQ